MAALLELRDRIEGFCEEYETFVKMMTRFVLAFITFLLININIGYMSSLHHVWIIVGLAVVCAFLPVNFTIFVAAVFVVVHLYALSSELAMFTIVLFFMSLLLYFRFVPKDGYLALVTVLLATIGVPYVVVYIAGLRKNLMSLIAILTGMVYYYFLKGVRESAALYRADDTTSLEVLKACVSQLVQNQEMIFAGLIFLLSAIIIYVVGRQSFNHARNIALSIGVIINVAGMLIFYMLTSNVSKIPVMCIGQAIAIVIAFLFLYLTRSLDYARVERVQFEDDEYYYFVKAIPKQSVARTQKLIKHYNTAEKEETTENEENDESEEHEEELTEAQRKALRDLAAEFEDGLSEKEDHLN
ncbi:hypothetical protein [Eubacterium oxidoreducens]|uniref:Uncharacterized protein n=1 Tax=Eubacterium oxidoreducens TaxID=1732 RepID=A0A1G6AD84_EUBOX|nr:hypothetical protein [Eubacterium oxidoreducens]SDB06276.1 hypothetical protein SAMN02910417_00438 [Eubacterium oxidoreducens]